MPSGVTYNTGALIAAERNSRRMWALHRRALERHIVPVVPAVVLAQAWRGGRGQAQVSRLLSGCSIEELNEPRARLTGVACGIAGTSDVIDAAVVVGAATRDDLVVTGDQADLRRLSHALRANLRFESV